MNTPEQLMTIDSRDIEDEPDTSHTVEKPQTDMLNTPEHPITIDNGDGAHHHNTEHQPDIEDADIEDEMDSIV